MPASGVAGFSATQFDTRMLEVLVCPLSKSPLRQASLLHAQHMHEQPVLNTVETCGDGPHGHAYVECHSEEGPFPASSKCPL